MVFADINVNITFEEFESVSATSKPAPHPAQTKPVAANGEAEDLSKPAKRETKRIRRSAEEARRLILDAAEERLASQGPEGIRLQDIARDVGISHPAILHHFESREGLVRALIARTSIQLREKILATLETKAEDEDLEANDIISNVFEALSDRGTARLLSWMLLTGRKAEDKASSSLVTEVAGELHKKREQSAEKNHRAAPDAEDTLFLAMLTTSAAFGDAIIGRELAKDAGLDQEGVKRFRKWFAKLLYNHVGDTH